MLSKAKTALGLNPTMPFFVTFKFTRSLIAYKRLILIYKHIKTHFLRQPLPH